jgi:hypothetical protein
MSVDFVDVLGVWDLFLSCLVFYSSLVVRDGLSDIEGGGDFIL